MILPLRRRHHRTFLVLAVLLPLLFAWGILARKSVPAVPGDSAPPFPSQEAAP